MPTVFCSFYGGSHLGVATDPISTQSITTSGVTARTASAAPAGAQIVGIFGDAAHYVNIGPQASVVASATDGVYVGANTKEYITIPTGYGVAAITA
jgi:hypothetical protein